VTAEMIEFKGRQVRRFVSYPEPVMDGTIRCGVCGQLDDEEFHDEATCIAVDRSSREVRALSKEGEPNG
jgi:hypothetical protein